MKEILELVNKHTNLEETLENLKEQNDEVVITFLEKKFQMLGQMLTPYREIMKKLDIKKREIILFSHLLDKNIRIELNISETGWLYILFDSIGYSLFNIKSINTIYYIKFPVLQELKLDKIVEEFRKAIIDEIKRKNQSLSIQIKQRKEAIAACNLDVEIKYFESMLNDLFELNNQYIETNNEKLIPLISHLIKTMEKVLIKEE